MPFTIAAFAARKEGVSPAQFQEQYEKHLNLLRETVGSTFPQSAVRHYVKRSKQDPTGEKPLSFTGSEETFGYDVVVFYNFADEAAAEEFQKKYEESQGQLAADYGAFGKLDNFRVIAFEDAISS